MVVRGPFICWDPERCPPHLNEHGAFYYVFTARGDKVNIGRSIHRGTHHLVYKRHYNFVRDYSEELVLGTINQWDFKKDFVKWIESVIYYSFVRWSNAVPFRHGLRIGFSYLVTQKYTGDVAAIKVLCSSETLTFNVKLKSHKRLIPAHNKGRPPSYYIVAGLVFTAVSVPYLCSEVTISLLNLAF